MYAKTIGTKFNEEQDIDMVSNSLPTNYKGRKNNFRVKKPDRHHFNQVIKVNITNNGTK